MGPPGFATFSPVLLKGGAVSSTYVTDRGECYNPIGS